MDETCKVPLKNVTADVKVPFRLSAFTNVTKGYNKKVCVICKNKHDSASVIVNFKQNTCNVTKNCPITTCDG